MKYLIALLAVLLMNICVFAQLDEKENIINLNQQTIALYNSGNVDEAEKSARKAVELSEKFYGLDSPETAVAYINLGVLQRQKEIYKDSVENLQNALNIYLKQVNFPSARVIELYEILAFSQFLNKNRAEAEKSYLAGLNLSENKFGVESKESFTPMLNLASFYARNKDVEKADEFYLKSYRLAKKNFGADSKQIESVIDSRICSTDSRNKKNFETGYEKIFGMSDESSSEKIISGKAIKLIMPTYPKEAREKGLTGSIKIRVEINEQGEVIEAHSVCGNGILETASEQAARMSKFMPALLNGSPIKVWGIMVYIF